jgi:hypothetical protein
VADHVTAVFAVPVTVAVNCWVPPELKVTEEGETLTVTPLPVLIVTVYD